MTPNEPCWVCRASKGMNKPDHDEHGNPGVTHHKHKGTNSVTLCKNLDDLASWMAATESSAQRSLKENPF